MQVKQQIALAVFLIWIAVTSYFLYDTVWGNYGLFDEKRQWATVAALNLTPQDIQLETSAGLQLVHVFSAGCSCNRYTAAHIAELTSALTADTLTADSLTADSLTTDNLQAVISVETLAAAGLAVPATPMALIFEHGRLIYAGPYATGPLCSVDNSLLADILSGRQILAGLWLNGETKACRCIASNAP
ncbi:DUF6436 domain-containing protein [Chromatiaceae bacterium AAb-1]|nr:DUF6436 domain-containing protein [Chromatiaceae bacterium AAb-1]